MDNKKPKIFLSYAREDMGMAKQLYNDLKRYGLDVWLDTESFLPGDKWQKKVRIIWWDLKMPTNVLKNRIAKTLLIAMIGGPQQQKKWRASWRKKISHNTFDI